MRRIYAVLALSICVLLSLSSCSVWNNSPYLYITEEQKQKLINRFNGYIDG